MKYLPIRVCPGWSQLGSMLTFALVERICTRSVRSVSVLESSTKTFLMTVMNSFIEIFSPKKVRRPSAYLTISISSVFLI